MINDTGHSEITYVLFGKEAVKLYRLSPKALMNSLDVDFHVGAYSSVRKFVSDTKDWDDFVEIPKEDFLLFRNLPLKQSERRPKKKDFFSKLFK